MKFEIKRKSFKLIVAILVCELAGAIGSIFTRPAIGSWYANLVKPAFTPPNWVFAPVWTILFALMGVSLFLVWSAYDRAEGPARRKRIKIALLVFGGQFVLNIFWSFLFFGLGNAGAAFVEIIFLWLGILATIIVFHPISRGAAWLLLPYLLWVGFAGFLNYSIWKMPADQIGPVYCAQDVRLCPDGSYVGRIPPRCEFAFCSNSPSISQQLRDCLPKSDQGSRERCASLLERLTDFGDCVNAGFALPVAETCSLPDGRIFIK
jgi:tryptophan-rich sensory protein